MTAWRREQARDRFFRRARVEGYRARSAYKLLELAERFKLIRPGSAVLDLGAAPGGWSQVAARLAGPGARLVAVDLSAMAPIPGVVTLRCDITDPGCLRQIREALKGDADVVLSDAAPSTSGIAVSDHVRSVDLGRAALDIARQVLRPGGSFVVKVFRGADFDAFVSQVRRHFQTARTVLPEATRRESREAYVVGLGFLRREEG